MHLGGLPASVHLRDSPQKGSHAVGALLLALARREH